MEIGDIKKNVNDLWEDTVIFWRDEMAKKYESVLMNEIDSLLQTMQNSCSQLVQAKDEALSELEKYKIDS